MFLLGKYIALHCWPVVLPVFFFHYFLIKQFNVTCVKTKNYFHSSLTARCNMLFCQLLKSQIYPITSIGLNLHI